MNQTAQKILFFIEGSRMTVSEQSAFDAIKNGEYTVLIRSNTHAASYQGKPEPAAYVAGAIPQSHIDFPVWEGVSVPDGSTLVTDGETVRVDFGSGVPAPGIAVADGKFDGDLLVKFDGTIGTLKDQQQFMMPVSINDSQAVTFTIVPTIVNGAITAFKLNEAVV